MLRITVNSSAHQATIKLEGRLSGPWVGELQRTWQSLAGAAAAMPSLIDLTDVTFIDAKGKKLLSEMHQTGAELRGGALMQLALDQITTHHSAR